MGNTQLGGAIILSLAWTPLFVMAALHIATIVFCVKENTNKAGNILGLITSLVGWIPIVGMIMHIMSAIIIMLDAYKSTQKRLEA